MARPRKRVVSGDKALSALTRWVHGKLDYASVSYELIAHDVYLSRPSVSRALCGRKLPSWQLVEAVAIRCGASTSEARKLWEAADASQRRRLARMAVVTPVSKVDSWQSLYRALGDLIVAEAGSQRELVRRDRSGLLTRSTVGAILRSDRSLSDEVLTQILTICEVSGPERAEWIAAWRRWGEPRREAMDNRRKAIARSRLQPWRYALPEWF